MSTHAEYKHGQHKFQCDRCGRTYWSENKAIEWTGAVVCVGPGTSECWEPRHSQDFVRSIEEQVAVSNTRERTLQAAGASKYVEDGYVDDFYFTEHPTAPTF